MVGLGADPHRVLVAAHRLVGARAPAPDLEVGPTCCAQLRGTPPPIVKMPRISCSRIRAAKSSRSWNGSNGSARLAGLAAQVVVDRDVEPELGVGERGHEHRHAVVVGAAQHAAPARLAARAVRPSRSQIMRLHSVVPSGTSASAFWQDPLDVVEVLLELDRVVDAVVALLVERLVAHRGLCLKWSRPAPSDEAVGHQRARRDDRLAPSRGRSSRRSRGPAWRSSSRPRS